ncbi:UPF0481 protein At3g47200-like [Carya illinoinensis]|uniref:UPF0481 protein At3g47200-like n=1 Tax=Carya illinoinensis TaxID=32201 RepID=UPI001C71DA3B|nr:UPF0481 protein At3g47200-like [Carya illinoinensis]
MAGKSARFDDQDDVSTRLSDEIAVMIESIKALPVPDHLFTCCIYKVSDDIRQSNKEAYTPQVISIGPFHRNNPKLQEMESFKLRHLERFLERAEKKLEDIISTVIGEEKRVRKSFSETITLGSDDFVKMILVDACFIIEFFWRAMPGDFLINGYPGFRDRESLLKRMQMDLILLENQLPFFIIEKIYNTAFPSLSIEKPIIDWLSSSLFKFYHDEVYEFGHHELIRDSGSSGVNILHFTDLLGKFLLPSRVSRPQISLEASEELMQSVA